MIGYVLLFGLLLVVFLALKNNASRPAGADAKPSGAVRASKKTAPARPSRGFDLASLGRTCRWLDPKIEGMPIDVTQAVDVRSFSFDSQEVYKVNLAAQTCTCKDWSNTRSAFPVGSPYRLCKHHVHLLEKSGLLQGQDEVTRWVLSHGKLQECRFLEVSFDHGVAIFAFAEGKEWVEVLAPAKAKDAAGAMASFGYNPSKNRWTYGTGPYKPMEAKGAIKAILGGRGVI